MMYTRKRNYPKTKETGFTLVEVITVLIILSIISSIAISKYYDIQQDAMNRALDGALAEGVSRVHTYFGNQVIHGQTPGAIVYDSSSIGTGAGDFTLFYAQSGDLIYITVIGKAGSVIGSSKMRYIERPR